MSDWVVLLRGINVGGKNKLAMAELRNALEQSGFSNVRSYVQSGNLRLSSRKAAKSVAASIQELIQSEFELSVNVICKPAHHVAEAIANSPFQPLDEKHLHLFFWQTKPKSFGMDELEERLVKDEEIALGDHAFYLHAPNGIARSKIATKVEKHLGVPLTARNLRTTKAILALS
ncbi:MAG: DUF1697 domain-containing protein [Aureliella sp.]